MHILRYFKLSLFWGVVLLSLLKAEPEGTPYQYDLMDADSAFEKKDYKQALQLYRDLDQAHSVEATETLGDFYLEGDAGLKRDYAKAKFYYERAIQNSIHNLFGDRSGYTGGWPNDEDRALLRTGVKLANMYAKGLGMPKNPKKAFDLYQRVLIYANDETCYPISKDWHFQDKSCKLDNSISSDYPSFSSPPFYVDWWFSPTNRAISDALYYVGNAYRQGKIVPQNSKQAIKYLSLAMDFQNKDIVKEVNHLLELAKEAKEKQDYKKAYDLYQQASSLHSIQAPIFLGDLLFEGQGIKQNKDRAGYFYALGYTRFWRLRSALARSVGLPTWNGEWDYDKSDDYNYTHQIFNDLANRVFYVAYQLAFLTSTHALKRPYIGDPLVSGFAMYQNILLFAKGCAPEHISFSNLMEPGMGNYYAYDFCKPKLLKPSDFDYARAKQSNIDTKTLGKTLYAVAQAYLKGLGTPKDEKLGLEYLKKAGEFRNKEATLALEKFNNLRVQEPLHIIIKPDAHQSD